MAQDRRVNDLKDRFATDFTGTASTSMSGKLPVCKWKMLIPSRFPIQLERAGSLNSKMFFGYLLWTPSPRRDVSRVRVASIRLRRVRVFRWVHVGRRYSLFDSFARLRSPSLAASE